MGTKLGTIDLEHMVLRFASQIPKLAEFPMKAQKREMLILKISLEIAMIPYLDDMLSKLTLNQWSHGQQPALTKGHLVIVCLKSGIQWRNVKRPYSFLSSKQKTYQSTKVNRMKRFKVKLFSNLNPSFENGSIT